MINFRLATESDLAALVEFGRRQHQTPSRTKFPDSSNSIEASLKSASEVWVIGHCGNEISAVVTLLKDSEHRLGKVMRISVNPGTKEPFKIQEKLLLNLLEISRPFLDVIYSTTRFLDQEQFELLETVGFKPLGFFPLHVKKGNPEKAWIASFFSPGILSNSRFSDFSLHPALRNSFDFVCKRLSLKFPPIAEVKSGFEMQTDPLPELELIWAPKFVKRRFQRLNERKILSNYFYPFLHPNVMICDPDEQVEIFVAMHQEKQFAAIMEERLKLSVNPVELYSAAAEMLRQKKISYVELIIDAADSVSIDFILQAGFSPCVYFPCLKKHGDTRRDYVILGKSFVNRFEPI